MTGEKTPAQGKAQTPPPPTTLPPQSSDPQKAPETKNSVAGMTLSGIVKMEEGYLALINNKIVKKGDTLDDRTILSIDKNQVEVLDHGEKIILMLGGL